MLPDPPEASDSFESEAEVVENDSLLKKDHSSGTLHESSKDRILEQLINRENEEQSLQIKEENQD